MKLRWLGLLIMGMLVGCTTPTKLPHKQADQVKMDYHGILDISHCTYKG